MPGNAKCGPLKICQRSIRCFLFLFSLIFFVRTETEAFGEDSGPAWGVSAMTLKPACTNTTSLEELLANDADCVSLKDFYRAGGVGVARAPTECRVAYSPDSLLVVLRCAEKDPSFPVIRHNVDWFSLQDSPPDQDSAFPDKVDVFIRPNLSQPSYYQFAVALDGSKFGSKRRLGPADEDEDKPRFSKLKAFDASVTKGTNEWIVFLRIP